MCRGGVATDCAAAAKLLQSAKINDGCKVLGWGEGGGREREADGVGGMARRADKKSSFLWSVQGRGRGECSPFVYERKSNAE